MFRKHFPWTSRRMPSLGNEHLPTGCHLPLASPTTTPSNKLIQTQSKVGVLQSSRWRLQLSRTAILATPWLQWSSKLIQKTVNRSLAMSKCSHPPWRHQHQRKDLKSIVKQFRRIQLLHQKQQPYSPPFYEKKVQVTFSLKHPKTQAVSCLKTMNRTKGKLTSWLTFLFKIGKRNFYSSLKNSRTIKRNIFMFKLHRKMNKLKIWLKGYNLWN